MYERVVRSDWGRALLAAPATRPGDTKERAAEQFARGGEPAAATARDTRTATPRPPWGGGRPLEEADRRHFERRLGAPLGTVRLHEGTSPARWASALGARAFAFGDDVVVGAGTGVRDVLDHELLHVVQQRRDARPVLARLPLSNADHDAIADQLFAAMDRWGTDEEAVFVGLQKLERDAAAIATLKARYRARHNLDLEAHVRSEMSGSELDFALELLGVPPAGGAAIAAQAPAGAAVDTAARRLFAAMDQWGTDEEAIYATLLPLGRDAGRSQALKDAYRRLFPQAPSLEDHLRSELSDEELSYALYLLNAPGPATGSGGYVSGGGGTPHTPAPPPVVGGMVEVATGVPFGRPGGGQGRASFALTYRGGLAAETHWLQFIWRDIAVTRGGATTRLDEETEAHGNRYRLTTNPSSPVYAVDSYSQTSPFYEDAATAGRTPDSTTLYDAPQPRRQVVAREQAAGATAVVSGAHFDAFLVRDYNAIYHVGVDVIHTYGATDAYTTQRNVRVTQVVDRLPDAMREALVRRYPAYDYIR